MFRKGGLSQETGIMSGLDRRGYAGGGNIGGGRISGTPMGSRTGFQDNRWERYGRNLKNLYSNIGKTYGASGVKGPGFTMSPPYTGTTLPVPYSKPPLLSERGLIELAKKGWGKGAGIMSGFAQRFPRIGPFGALALKSSMIKPSEVEEEYGVKDWEKAWFSSLPGSEQQYLPLAIKSLFGKKKKPCLLYTSDAADE